MQKKRTKLLPRILSTAYQTALGLLLGSTPEEDIVWEVIKPFLLLSSYLGIWVQQRLLLFELALVLLSLQAADVQEAYIGQNSK